MKTKPEQWIEAWKWSNGRLDIPTIVDKIIQREYNKAIRKAKVYKPAIKVQGKKIKSIPKLKKELDKVFSIFIRKRDSNGEIGRCVTCGRVALWMTMDCGHFVPRQHLATRWDEDNCYLQCKRCNGFEGGKQVEMAEYINLIHGTGAAEELKANGKKKFKLWRFWLEGKIEHYKKLEN